MSRILRTSSLDKLKECPRWEGTPGDAGPKAMRGTLSDQAGRLANMGETLKRCEDCGQYQEEWGLCTSCKGNLEVFDPLEVLDERIAALGAEYDVELEPAAENVQWALDTYRKLVGPDAEIITDEAQLKVDVTGLDGTSTADLNSPSICTGGDFKTGAISSYLEQMRGYSEGFMRKYFSDKWTMHLLFMDHRHVVTHDFTYDEARSGVLAIRAKHLDAEAKATPCKYCIWCVKADSCAPRIEAAQRALEFGNVDLLEGFDEIRRSPAKLAAFLDGFDALRPLAQTAEGDARWKLEEDPDSVPGWRLNRVDGIHHVTAASLKLHTKKLPKGEALTLEKVFDALERVTPYQFKKIMESVNKPLPKRYTSRGRKQTFLNKK